MKKAALTLLLTAFCTSCASTGGSDAAPGKAKGARAEAKAAAKKEKSEELARKLEVARARLEVKVLEEKAFARQNESALRFAHAELADAEAKLAKFREVDAPARTATEALNLRTAADRAQEAKDELAQIEIMYEDQDLDDLTAEFVVSRGRRAAERAQARIEIQEAAFRSLKERELPQQEAQLSLAVDKARSALEKAELDGEIGRQGKAIAVLEARNAVEELERELKEAKP